MDRLLAHLASDGPWWRARPRKYDPSCGARFVDLDRAVLPDLPGGVETDVLRQRVPPRDAVPQRRTTAPSATWDMPMLSGVQSATLVLLCRRCGRRDAYEVADLLAAGGDRRLTDVSWELRAICPKREAPALHERCDVVLEAGE